MSEGEGVGEGRGRWVKVRDIGEGEGCKCLLLVSYGWPGTQDWSFLYVLFALHYVALARANYCGVRYVSVPGPSEGRVPHTDSDRHPGRRNSHPIQQGTPLEHAWH